MGNVTRDRNTRRMAALNSIDRVLSDRDGRRSFLVSAVIFLFDLPVRIQPICAKSSFRLVGKQDSETLSEDVG